MSKSTLMIANKKFICYSPYVVDKPSEDFYEGLSASDREVITHIFSRCLGWAHEHKIIDRSDRDGVVAYVRRTTESRSSLASIIITTNLREFVADTPTFTTFMKSISDTENGFLHTSLIQFATTLTILFGPDPISLLIDRIYQSYNAVPPEKMTHSWEEFHKKYPSMWVVFLIQNAILGLTKIK